MNNPWNPDFDISHQLASVILTRQFPALAPIHIERLDAGWDNTVFLVNEITVFRFPRRHIAVPLLEREHRILPLLNMHFPDQTPHLSYIGTPCAEYPHPFSGYHMLPGQPAHKVGLHSQRRHHTAEQLGRFLRKLHEIPIEKPTRLGIDGDTLGRMNTDDRIPKYTHLVQTAQERHLIPSAAPFLTLTESLPRTVDIFEHRVLAHGDLNFRNFLVQDSGALTAVIDWGDIHVGHPAVDLAIAHVFFPPYAQSAFWRAYGVVDDETHRLARFRGAYTLFNILLSADDVGDTAQVYEARQELNFVIGPQ